MEREQNGRCKTKEINIGLKTRVIGSKLNEGKLANSFKSNQFSAVGPIQWRTMGNSRHRIYFEII